ncbi:hypothetical protein D3C76_718340 [compost metagenome]
MQLIDNANKLHQMTSVLIAAATGALAVADQVLPALHGIIPPAAYAVLSALVIVARAVKQPSLAK